MWIITFPSSYSEYMPSGFRSYLHRLSGNRLHPDPTRNGASNSLTTARKSNVSLKLQEVMDPGTFFYPSYRASMPESYGKGHRNEKIVVDFGIKIFSMTSRSSPARWR